MCREIFASFKHVNHETALLGKTLIMITLYRKNTLRALTRIKLFIALYKVKLTSGKPQIVAATN